MRAALKSFYDIQKIRIQVGNRIAGNARIKLGQEPGKKSDTLDAVALKLINRLVVAYRRLTDGLADPNTREKVKALEKSDGVITDLLEFELIGQYTHLLDQ